MKHTHTHTVPTTIQPDAQFLDNLHIALPSQLGIPFIVSMLPYEKMIVFGGI